MNSQMVNGIGNNGIGDGLSANLDSQMVNDIGNNVNNFNSRIYICYVLYLCVCVCVCMHI